MTGFDYSLYTMGKGLTPQDDKPKKKKVKKDETVETKPAEPEVQTNELEKGAQPKKGILKAILKKVKK